MQTCTAVRLCWQQSKGLQAKRSKALLKFEWNVLSCRIAELAAEEGRAVVLVVNKWDLAGDTSADGMKNAEANVKEQLRPVQWAKVVFTSAISGARTFPRFFLSFSLLDFQNCVIAVYCDH